MGRSFRFDPPEVKPREELVWLLRRAFGPVDLEWEPLATWARLVLLKLADQLDVAARIASRTPTGRLETEAGAEAAAGLSRAQASVATVSLIVDRVCDEIAAAAAAISTPAIFLKGAALQLGGVVPAGSRSMGDVDVLVPQSAADELQSRLVKNGALAVEGPASDHQLQWLKHPSGLGIEVHTAIPGVRLDGRSSASADEVLEMDGCRRLDAFPGQALILKDHLMLAHLLVHGLAQHGLKPDSYPSTRMVADLGDLVPDATGWSLLQPEVMPWIERDVTEEEVGACRDVVLDLATGIDPASILGFSGHRGRFLRHVVAAAIDPEYGRAIRLQSLARPVAAGGSSRRLLQDAFRTVWLTDAQIEQLYGKPFSKTGYWLWRLWRPFDLVGRAWRYGAAWAKHRFRW